MQNTADYRNEIFCAAPAATVYYALTKRIAEWWSTAFSGHGIVPGDEFTVRFGNSFKTMRVVNTVIDELVEWECIDQHIEMPATMDQLQNPQEWVGNTFTWLIETNGDNTCVRFCHHGLTSASECWAVCEPGWNQALQSLQSLLTTGQGRPFRQLDDERMKRANELYQSRGNKL